ncbi:MAG TPA: phosphohistidine phosphatase SixA [Terriglobia bacterium]|nr:phosphohistidine phosphatase SixA [Terriglobia bacterium]
MASAREYELFIMRHGIAVDRGTPGYADDAKRPLTPEGKNKTRLIAKGLVRLGLDLDWIVSSPLVRAVETAGLVSGELETRVPMDLCDALAPGGSAEALISYLAKQANRRRVMVVGHEPDLSDLAARLMGAGRHANLTFKKGGCCLLRFSEFPPKSPGRLVWWLTPRVMRKLA